MPRRRSPLLTAVTESQLQQAIVQRARHDRLLRHLMAIPNGAHLAGNARQRAAHMARLKAEGLVAGASDLLLPVPVLTRPLEAGEAVGLWLELKRPAVACRPSAMQAAFHDAMQALGYETATCNDLDQALALLDDYATRAGR